MQQANTDKRALHLSSTMSIQGAFLASGWAFAYWWLDYPVLCYASFAGMALLSLVMAVALVRGLARSTSMLISITGILVTLGINAVFSDGNRSGMIVWLLMVPILALFVEARRAAAIFMGIVCAFIVGLAVADGFGALPEPHVPYQYIQLPISFITAAWFMALGVRSFEMTKDAAMEQMRETRDALQSEVEHHRSTQARLESARDEVIAAAHFSGMAEVATGVLHNVGNGLNAVNVSAALLAERLVPKTAERVERLADLLEQPEAASVDTRAAGAYARRVAESAQQERADMRQELEQLREALEHVKAIVQAQQGYARSGGHICPVRLDDAVEQTLLLIQSSMRNEGTDLQLDLSPLPPIVLDRHKLVQVLTNLVGNARDAVASVSRPGRIAVAIRRLGDNAVIEVADNGVGIAPDVRDKLFEHGFTTKETGHGFGLHVSALSASELGGRLEVESAGLDQGAVFRLVLESPHWSDVPLRGLPA